MYEIILIGESGAFDATPFGFYSKSGGYFSWQEGATEALYRYGDCDDIIEKYEDKNTSHLKSPTIDYSLCDATRQKIV